MDDIMTQWKNIQKQKGFSDDEIVEKIDGIVRLSAVSVFSKFFESLSEDEKKKIEAVEDDSEAEKLIEDMYLSKHGKSIAEEVTFVQDEFFKAYIEGKDPVTGNP